MSWQNSQHFPGLAYILRNAYIVLLVSSVMIKKLRPKEAKK